MGTCDDKRVMPVGRENSHSPIQRAKGAMRTRLASLILAGVLLLPFPAVAGDITGIYINRAWEREAKESGDRARGEVVITGKEGEYAVRVSTSFQGGFQSCGFEGPGELRGKVLTVTAVTLRDERQVAVPVTIQGRQAVIDIDCELEKALCGLSGGSLNGHYVRK